MKTNKFLSEKLIFIFVVVAWFILIMGSLIWDWYDTEKNAIEMAKTQGLAAYQRDISYRLWGAMVGGVYVSADKVKPNPYLSFLKERDVVTTSGKKLTLVNPAYMTRMVYEMAGSRYGILVHLTSLKPLNPKNAPDKWERKALLSFEKGKKEAFLLEKINGKRYLRYMKPFVTEEYCLKCHKRQGYKVGDIRGAVSIFIPFDTYFASIAKRHNQSIIIHGLIFLFGLSVLLIGASLLRRSKAELIKNEERLRTLMNAMPDIVCFKDGEGRWLEANQFDLKLFGLEGVDYRGKKDSELAKYSEFYKDAFLNCEKTDELAWQKKGPTRGEEVIPLPNGDYRIFDVIKVPLFYEDGRRKGLVIVGRDITEQKKVQEQLENVSRLKGLILHLAIDFINIPLEEFHEHIDESLELVSEFLDIDRAYLISFDHSRNVMSITNEWCARGVESRLSKNREISKEEFIGWINAYKYRETVLVEDVDKLEDGGLKSFLTNFNVKSFILFPIKNNDEILGAICFEFIKASKKWSENYITVLKLLSAIYANAILRSKILEQLKESEKKYRELFERIPAGLYQNTPEPNGRFLVVNQALVDMFGYDSIEEMLKVPVVNLYPDASLRIKFSEKLMQEGSVKDHEMQLKRKNGSLFWVSITANVVKDSNGNILYFEGAVQDITRRKEAEKEKEKLQLQLQQAQKLESIGRLAGGVAHDLNNLLLPILGYNELILNRLDRDSEAYQFVERVSEAAERARDIVRQLLAFSRKDIFDIVPLDLNKVLVEFEKLLRRTIREDIEIVLELAPNLPTIKADKGKIEQVILNLAINAQDAMPDGGTLTLETALVELDEEYASSHRGVIPGSYVCLSISDTGHGMDEETMKHIFEPFFTTKPKESGTGLGLATVYGIVKQHKGNIWVYSEVGKGTTFKIYLPVSGEEEIIEADIEYLDEELEGTETVLLVEDNDEVRELVRDILKEHGYRVVEAKDPVMAIKEAQDSKDKIQLLLTDVIMPKMNGKELYEKLIQFFPDLKVVYMSGYTENVISEHGVLKRGIHFISKPFSRITLLKTIKKALKKQ